MTIFGNPSVFNFLWLIVGGFAVGFGWTAGAWLWSRIAG
jgi:uncharacterized membrane protein YccF (DUF307 family)